MFPQSKWNKKYNSFFLKVLLLRMLLDHEPVKSYNWIFSDWFSMDSNMCQ